MKSYDEIVNEMERLANNETKEDKRISCEDNSMPCEICGNTEFIQKYRNVVGKIKGEIQGNYSLFGGSISGYIDGNINTLPVLCCRKCQNERLIKTYNITLPKDIFWDYMFHFYQYIKYGYRQHV